MRNHSHWGHALAYRSCRSRGPTILTAAIVLVTAALAFYSIGVWAERIRQILRWWHVVFFGLGFSSDLSGTVLMTRLSIAAPGGGAGLARTLATLMALTGSIAVALMALHLVWAIIVLLRNRDSELHRFQRFSLVVWSIWLVPFIAGAVAANLA